MKLTDTMDGNQAASYSSYFFTEVAAIYPITPSSPMAENIDEWAAKGKLNIFNQKVKIVQMQSEAGAAGALHGSLAAGALTSSYTSSQGLLLMIPNIYKMVGELLPGVLHVAARALATHALSIFGDHQDVMACRQTGAIMLAASNVQEALDFSIVSHLTALKARLPVIHFFDGFRTSHEYEKINLIADEDLTKITDFKLIDDFRNRALSPEHPVVRGTAQNPDIYFQGREVQNKYFNQVPEIAIGYLQKLFSITGRQYHLFDYYGAPDAEKIIIAMGSVCDTNEETVDYLIGNGEKVGAIKVHLYRPFSEKYLLEAIPKTVKKIAVLDRTKEPGSTGEPLYLDVVKTIMDSEIKPVVVGGRYGLGSKDTRPSDILAVFNNLNLDKPKSNFTISIKDDVTFCSLPEVEMTISPTKDTISCKFWGLGSDGTVGANKSAIKIIGNHTDLYVQGYFSYDSKKSGGSTVSHLRFGKNPIKSHYLVYEADYIACHNKSFINNLDVLKGIKKDGIFVLNCDWKEEELEKYLPDNMKKTIAEKNISFYTIDAVTIAQEIGLGNRINMIMQSAFFKLINIIPVDKAVSFLKDSIVKSYSKKGQKIVDINNKAVDIGIDKLVKISVPESWSKLVIISDDVDEEKTFINTIQSKMAKLEGDELPVSAFNGMEDGSFPLGVTAFEKRGIAVMVPEWQIDKCIECGQCSFVCPHATIRLFLLNEEEANNAPSTFKTRKATGKGAENYRMRVQVSPLDCTGCGNCADVCPVKEKALIMKPAEQEIDAEIDNWEFAMTIKQKQDIFDKNTIKGSQYIRPLLEFNGACPGCGETPYIRLLTQLFGDRMMIANATGCSSIWGASAPSIAYTTTAEGKGPSWGNSLFEDNAEYGYGMYLGVKQIRERITALIEKAINEDIDAALKDAFKKWLDNKMEAKGSKEASELIISLMKDKNYNNNPTLAEIIKNKDYLVKRSFWMIGGDGWAYDIDYGGVDHVLASGEDINIFVMDTEIYSNTGGQSSKATPASAIAKFAVTGKKTRKKDLGRMIMSYNNVYVAQISLGSNMNQTLKAITEAESYNGPSLIIAYSPCISHGIKTGMGTSIAQEKKAVEAGYWHLYRYNPQLITQGKNPFILDSKEPKASYIDFIKSEVRYSQLENIFPDTAEGMYENSEKQAKERYEAYKNYSENPITKLKTGE